ncbi:MAG: UDP-N-acetylglucosamine--LPS N-acetylglucosamine transferase [Alphaproteobacteria bacterium]|nr:UDP-N-acetylglucosamine--LPS N-acetylglucosamine transferase [Alphaproteobacteria bacterium]
MSNHTQRQRVLAVASGGGHWIQLLRLRPAFAECEISYVTVNPDSRGDVPGQRFFTVPDGNRDTKFAIILMALKMLLITLWVRPHVVVSTGAAPGYFACRFGRMIGARSLFVDSVANAEEMSLSAKLAMSHADKVFTQWQDVSKKFGAEYHGSVL